MFLQIVFSEKCLIAETAVEYRMLHRHTILQLHVKSDCWSCEVRDKTHFFLERIIFQFLQASLLFFRVVLSAEAKLTSLQLRRKEAESDQNIAKSNSTSNNFNFVFCIFNKMLDLFTIFTKGGIVLWCFRSTNELFAPSVNALIKNVLMQVSSGRVSLTQL